MAAMTQAQFQAAKEKLGLHTHKAVADMLGVSLRTARRMATMDYIEQTYAANLRVAIRYKLTPQVFVEEFGD